MADNLAKIESRIRELEAQRAKGKDVPELDALYAKMDAANKKAADEASKTVTGETPPVKKAKGGEMKAKRYDEGGVLSGMKDIIVEGGKKIADDFQRIAGTEKGKQLDKEAQKEMYKRASNAAMKAAAQELKNERVRAEAGRYKKGGSIKSASARADGIAIRGKTRA